MHEERERMPAKKIVKVRKNQDFFAHTLGMHIMRLVSQGYRKFIIEDYGEVVVIETWRRKKKEDEEP